MGARHGARIAALQALFALDANPDLAQEEAVARACAETEGALDRRFAAELVAEIWSRRSELDDQIGEASRRWRVDRMDRIDRNILRLGVCELACRDEPPAPIVLDEAVEIAKRFGTGDSPAFVNGILDRIARDLRPEEVRHSG